MLPEWMKRLAPGGYPRGFGLLGPDQKAPQETGAFDWDFDQLGLLGAAVGVDEVDLSKHIVSVLDQGAANTCVAHVWEQAIRMERHRLGYPVELGSRLFGYSNSRAEHGMAKRDVGTFLRTYAWALKKLGNCPESTWPYLLRNVNVEPPPKAFRRAWAMRGIRGYYKIYDQRYARTAAIRAALAQGKPVVFGSLVDGTITDPNGPHLLEIPKGEIIGGHAMLYVGYRRVTQDFQYKIVNSYGGKWRANGYAWVSEEYAQWTGQQDFWVVSLR